AAMSLIPLVPPLSRSDVERLGVDFVAQHAPLRLEEPRPFPVLAVFEDLDLRHPELETGVDYLGDGVEGACWPDGRVLLSEATYLGVVNGDGRSRFTTVHEIFHGLYHRRHIKRV